MNASQIETLISLVETKKLLYNKRDKLFKDKHAKEKAWQNIAEQLDIVDTEEVKKCWANLRDRFGRERRQKLNIPSGSEAVEFTWPYYGAMMYLEPYILGRKTKSNVQMYEQSTSAQPTLEEEIFLVESVTNDDIEHINMKCTEGTLGDPLCEDNASLLDKTNTSGKSTPVSISGKTTPTENQGNQGMFKRKRRSSSADQDILSLHSTLASVAAILSESNATDSDMAFGKYVGTRLKEMNKTEKNRVKLKIMQILDEDD